MKALVLFVLSALSCQALAQHSITPGAAYRLTFEAEGQAGRYAIHLRDAGGNLPFDGALEAEWQTLEPERKTYTHLFYAPADAATVELRGNNVKFSNIQLVKDEPENLLLNGDFSEGVGNYSGWSERYNAELAENDGRTILRVNQNGYALTDYTPVVGGGRYQLKSKQGSPGCSVLAYDRFRRLIGIIERKHSAPFDVPENAAYIRVIYSTWHDHLPNMRMNEIVGAELREQGIPETEPAKIERNGEWEIVLAAGSDPREEYAARELRHWITEITGKAPALLAEPGKGKARKIFVGRAWAASFKEDLKELEGSEGYAVRAKDGNIHVFGPHPRGSIYGVHALLERNTDIIWPRPSPEFEVLFSKTGSLSFADADFISRPVFSGRYFSGNHYNQSIRHILQSWQGRNGLNSPWKMHVGNNYLAWQRGAKLGYTGSHLSWALRDGAEKDEKILPLVDGKRDTSNWRQPCYTYQGTVDAIVANIKAALEMLPGRDMEYIASVIADNWTVCGCPDCLAPIILPNGGKLETSTTDAAKNSVFFSTRNFMMLNKVAEALEKDYPNLRIQTHAYIFTAEPPKVKIHPMIIPEFAAYPTQNLRYPILSGEGKGQVIASYTKDIWKRRFEQWGRDKKGELGYFGYYHPEGFSAVADAAAQDYRDLAKFQAVQVHPGGSPLDGEELSLWDADGIEKWVIAKLMWDPSQDPESLRKHYISRVYRGAEKEMGEFYKLIRDTWHGLPEAVFVNCHTSEADLFQELMIKPKNEEKARNLLVSAEKAATDPRSKAMIGRTLAYFDKLADTLGRVAVPHVEESKNEWLEPSSPHWEKAAVVEGFRKVDDWRGFEKAETEHPTKVRIMHDRENLYIRFDGSDGNPAAQVKPSGPAGPMFPKGDCFEVRLRTAGKKDYYLAAGPGGHDYSLPPIGGRLKTVVAHEDKSWTAIMAVPLNILGGREEEREGVKVRFGRMYRLQSEDSEESTHNGAGIFNEHASLWLDLQIK